MLLLRLIDYSASIEDIFESSLVGRSERVLSITMQFSSLVNFSVNFGCELLSDCLVVARPFIVDRLLVSLM